MSLSAGEKLGPYEILALIGAGGMGEVYRARDTKLKREVALKVLPEIFASDPGRMARFEREAEVLASLNHPGIAHIYGIEECALVMELVEGQNLPCPLPVEEALRLARQIAEALEYAHERGVIHRDLKPANIKVTPEGSVKILDFGLAKVLDDDPPPASGTDSPTMTLGHTRAGMILGTAAYMSPEQAVGKPADRRSDIFSFGSVLYEMLTGQRAFTGDSAGETLVAVAKDDPDWSKLPAGSPEALLRRCLTKDRKQRLQAIGEARIALENPVGQVSDLPSPGAGRRPALLPWITAVLALALAAPLAWIAWRATQPVERPLVRVDVDLGPEVSLFQTGGASRALSGRRLAISPDSARLVYLASVPGGGRKLFMRGLDQAVATELPGTEGASAPFFSPDSRWVGFLAGTKINKVPVDGGAATPVLEVGPTGGGSNAAWGENGIFFSKPLSGMIQVLAAGGSSTPVMQLEGEFAFLAPQVLPRGKAVLYATYPSPAVDGGTIEAVSLDSHRRKKLLPGASPVYVPSGHLLYMSRGVLFAVPFDPERLETRGEPVAVLEDVAAAGGLDEVGQFDVSRTGTLVYLKAQRVTQPTSTVEWLDSGGKKQPLIATPASYANLRLSPDGKKLAFAIREPRHVEVYDLQRETHTALNANATNGTPI